jgi:hypothetical protein
MANSNWKDVAEIVGMTAIVASLIFVGFQMRQDRQIAEAQIFSHYGESHTVWVGLVTSNMDTWIAGLDGSELNGSENARFEAMALAYNVHQRSKYLRSTRLAGNAGFNIMDTANFIHQHKGLMAWYAKHRDYLARRDIYMETRNTGSFSDKLNQTVDGLANGEISPVSNNSYMPNN